MLKLAINHLLFLCILTAQFLCRRKLGVKACEKKVDYLFAFLYCLLFWYELKYGYVIIDGTVIAINIIIFFILGMIFNIKQIIIILFCTLILLLLNTKLYGKFVMTIIIDMFSLAIYVILGRFCKIKIFKKSYPSVIYSVMFATILVSIYAIISLIVYIVKEQNGIFIFDYLPAELIFRILWGIVIVGSCFLVFSIFDKNKAEEEKKLINIFTKKYNYLIVIFCIFAVFFSYIFIFIYQNYNYSKTLKFNFEMAKEEVQPSYEKYGDDYISKDVRIREIFNTWTLDLAGGVYLLDENFNKANDFVGIDENNFLSREELKQENFKDIIKYEKNKIFKYKCNGFSYMLIYDKIGNYYIVAFFSYNKLFEYAFTPTSATLFAIILNVIIVFLLVYYLFNKYVVNRLLVTNKKLNKITEGDYDIVFDDNSSIEFAELSENINKTVDTLKSNINEIKKRNKEEFELARRIQVSQLPAESNATIAYNSYGINIPAEDIGGDFYDNFSVDNKRRIFLIADVSGKGISGALFMMKAKHTIINLAKQHEDMGQIFDKANKILCTNNDDMMFVTCFAIMINLETGQASFVNAGHNKPIIRRYVDGHLESEYIDVETCRIMGIDKKSVYNSVEINLKKNDSIILYTDGVTEAKNINKELYGNERLLDVVTNIGDETPKNVCDIIVNSVHTFAGTAPQSDDITIHVVKYNGNKNTLKYSASFDDIDEGKIFINKFISLYDINVDLARNLKVVYDEIACNIIKYAYDDSDGVIILELNYLENNIMEMIFKDKGKEFDPTKHTSDKITADDKINGGMGIMFCMNMMDECIYKRENGYNILTLRKKVS